jgi:hypothetical protein
MDLCLQLKLVGSSHVTYIKTQVKPGGYGSIPNSEESLTPPWRKWLVVAELARRLCAETFTHSSSVPISFYQCGLAMYIYGSDIQEKDLYQHW